MDITIVGTGGVGVKLATGLVRAGHVVTLASRDPAAASSAAAVEACGAAGAVGYEALADAEVVALALPHAALAEVLPTLPLRDGCIVIDLMNRVMRHDDGAMTPHPGRSLAEEVAGALPTARVVKAFNTIGAEHFLDADFGGTPADIQICGDDAEAKSTVAGIAADLGFTPVDCGPLTNARLTEHVGALWIWFALASGEGRDLAFKLLRG